MSTPPPVAGGSPWDGLAHELQAVRHRAGDPSYAEIARRVTEQRMAAGDSLHAARVARTTVFDCFRTGRARVNLAFAREIALVLGADDAQVDDWIAHSRAGPVPELPEAPEFSGAPDPPPTEPPAETSAAWPAPRVGQVVLLLTLGLGANLLGRVLVGFLGLPIFLDMLGTAVVAIVLGPWLGALVGGATNAVGVLASGLVSLPFALVNICGALVWGYGVRRLGLGRTLPRFLLLNVLVAVACTLTAVPILLSVGGSTGHGSDGVLSTVMALTRSLPAAVGVSNIMVSLADKLICGFVALVVISALPQTLRGRLHLTLVAPGPATSQDQRHAHRSRPDEGRGGS